MMLKRILPLVSLVLLPFYAEAQWMHKGIGNNIRANMPHKAQDELYGIPASDIEEHLKKHHQGISMVSTDRPTFAGNFYRMYTAIDNTQFVNIGTSRDKFVLDSKESIYFLMPKSD